MKPTNWELKSKKKIANADDLIDVLLDNRNIKSDKSKKEFLQPKDPREITPKEIGINAKDFVRSVKRIKKAIEKKEKIVIFGDYDADGISATAILWEALHALHADATPYIPDRFEDGYGINKTSIEKIKNKFPETSLLITVDNGIVAFDGVKKAAELGVDVIITDHHAKEKKIPDAYSIIHTTKTSGSGVSWFLAKALAQESAGLSLELAAIGTISDQLPLTGVNRSIAKYGIKNLNTTKRTGLKKLFATAGLLGKKIGTYEINFVIAPRINASGRISQGMDALRLLCTINAKRAEDLATLLNELNLERQNIVANALTFADTSIDVTKSSVIILSNKDFHEGVIGLIASRITEKYYRPTIVMALREGVAKASARSIEGFNIISAIREHNELIIEGGGHGMAAGFSIKTENIETFTTKINTTAKLLLTDETLARKVKIDSEIDFKLIGRPLYDKIEALEPFGVGNPAPVFVSKNVNVVSQKAIGSTGKHKKILFEKDSTKLEGLFFNCDQEIKTGKADILYKLNLNEWNGKSTVELLLKDVRQKI